MRKKSTYLGKVMIVSFLLLGGLSCSKVYADEKTIKQKDQEMHVQVVSLNPEPDIIQANTPIGMTGQDATVTVGTTVTEEDLFDLFKIKVINTKTNVDVTEAYKNLLFDIIDKNKLIDTSKVQTSSQIYKDQNDKILGDFKLKVEEAEKPVVEKAGKVKINFVIKTGNTRTEIGTSIEKDTSTLKVGDKIPVDISDFIQKNYTYVGTYPVTNNKVSIIVTNKDQNIDLEFNKKEISNPTETKTGKVTFKYVDENGNQIINPVINTGKVGDKVFVSLKNSTLGNYQLIRVENGVYKDEKVETAYNEKDQTITLVFRQKVSTKVRDSIVTIYDQDGVILYNNKIQIDESKQGTFEINIKDYGNYTIERVAGATLLGDGKTLILDKDTSEHIKIFVKKGVLTENSDSEKVTNKEIAKNNSETEKSKNTVGTATGAKQAEKTEPKTGSNLISSSLMVGGLSIVGIFGIIYIIRKRKTA